MRALHVILLVNYPIFVHLSIAFKQPLFQVIALSSLAAGLSFAGLRKMQPIAWGFFLSICSISALLAYYDSALFLLYVPPVALPIIIGSVFIASLLPGKEPLVTAIGEASRGPLSLEMRRYTKGVTIFWAITLAILTLIHLVLPIMGETELWSWMTNLGTYLIIGLLFLLEFLLRKQIFPDHDHPGFFEYIQIVVSSNVRK